MCRSPGNGGFRKGSGFSQAPQLENGSARAHSHLSVTPGTLGLGDKWEVGCQVLLLEQLLIINLGWRRWVKWSEEERPWMGRGRLGREPQMADWGAECRVKSRTWGPHSLGQICSATYQWCNWISVPQFLICEMGILVRLVPASQGCVRTESWVSVCCYYVLFLFLFYRCGIEALRGRADKRKRHH